MDHFNPNSRNLAVETILDTCGTHAEKSNFNPNSRNLAVETVGDDGRTCRVLTISILILGI